MNITEFILLEVFKTFPFNAMLRKKKFKDTQARQIKMEMERGFVKQVGLM